MSAGDSGIMINRSVKMLHIGILDQLLIDKFQNSHLLSLLIVKSPE